MITTEFTKYIKSLFQIDGLELITEFFIIFSRFECALKQSITFAKGDDQKVIANWTSFAQSIEQAFDQTRTSELNTAVEYIITNPPKIQILTDSQLSWRNRSFKSNIHLTEKLERHIRDIRNNLFHGGKFDGNYERDISRNYILLKNGIIILNEWLELSPSVQYFYLQAIE